MTTICAYQFEVEPLPGQMSEQCLIAIWQLIAERIQGMYRNTGLPVPPLDRASHFVVNPLRHAFRITQQYDSAYRLVTLDWEMPDENHPTFFWHLSVVLACDVRMVELALVYRFEPEAFQLCPPAFSPVPLRACKLIGPWLGQVLRGWPCRIGEQQIPAHARTLHTEEHVETFTRSTLLNPKRTVPVVLCDLAASLAITRQQLRNYQEPALGLAAMVGVLSPPAMACLDHLLGEERSCTGGLRVCWPGFSMTASPKDHPFYSWTELQQVESLDAFLYAKLAEVSVDNYREGPFIRKARDSLALLPPPKTGPKEEETGPAHGPAELQQAQGERNAAQSALRVAQRERDAAQTRLKETQHEWDATLTELKEVRRARQAEETNARKEQNRAAARLARVETDLKDVRQERERFRKEWDAAQQRATMLERELADAQAQLGAAHEALTNETRQNEFYAEMESTLHENERLQAECETARRRIAELEADLHNTRDNLAKLWEAPPAEDPAAPPPSVEERKFAAVADALRAAAEEFADVLTVWDDALKSAEASRFAKPSKVFHALRAIAAVGREYFKAREGGAPLGPVDQAFRQHVPFKYANCESQTTMSLFGAARVFHHRDQSRQMQRHLTLGGGDTRNCLQIYFEFDDGCRRVLIGHCGRHLPYVRQRT